ncbi:MAG: glycine betaine ABC transporter substrate-binding protein [Deltaproteobacteria bacterium]|nr:glycine betaine ABC transporter substrate-binding protein [Deltaproteobacteria bacterium]
MIQGKKFVLCLLLAAVMTVTFTFGTAAAEEKKTLSFGVVAWSEALAEGELIKYIMEKEIGQPVKITNPDIGVAYTAIANGDLDLFIESWLPMTHEAYWDKIASKVCDFGPIYEDASLGWAVPNYIPKDVFNSVTDMGKAEVMKKCDGKIIGIDPGSGLMQHSALMMKRYPELKDWKLIEGSDYAMVASLKRAMQRKEWVVVTLWKPHFAFSRFDIRYIEEPRKILGTEERSHMIGRRDFMDVFPSEVSSFLSRLYFTIDQVNELVDLYEKDEDTAAEKFIKNHPKLVHYWVTGEVGD